MSTAYRSENGSTSRDSEGAERTVGQLFASATADLSSLVHDEIRLATKEIKQDAVRGGAGAAAGLAAGVILVASIPVFSFAIAYGIHSSGLGLVWCFLITGGAFVLLAILAGLVAWRLVKKISPPDRTIASTKATVDVLKTAKPRPAVGPADELPAIRR